MDYITGSYPYNKLSIKVTGTGKKAKENISEGEKYGIPGFLLFQSFQ